MESSLEKKTRKSQVLNHFKLKHEIVKRNNILTECYQTCPLPNVPIFFTLLTLRVKNRILNTTGSSKSSLVALSISTSIINKP